MDEEDDSRTAVFERKRPFESVTQDGTKDTSSTGSPSRKRSRHANKAEYQDLRDFVPVGATFSTTGRDLENVDEDHLGDDVGNSDNDDEENEAGESLGLNDQGNGSPIHDIDAAIVEGRRLEIGNLPVGVTKTDIEKLFKGKNVEIPQRSPRENQPVSLRVEPEDQVVVKAEDTAMEPTDGKLTPNSSIRRRLYVGNLAYQATEEDLLNLFYGYPIENVSLPINPRTQRPVGYAFVELLSSLHADRAINDLSGRVLLERKISVQEARPPAPDPVGLIGAFNDRQPQYSKHDVRGELPPDDRLSQVSKHDIKRESSPEDGSFQLSKQHIKRESSPEENISLKSESSSDEEMEIVKNEFGQQALDTGIVTDTVPRPMNWNSGNGIKIRTTLGGKNDVVSSENVGWLPKQESMLPKQVKSLHKACDRMGAIPHKRKKNGNFYDAEVDYNYCLYYPPNFKWLNPPQIGPRTNSKHKRTGTLEWRIQFWDLVKNCMRQGTLPELKDWRLRVTDQNVLTELLAQQSQKHSGKPMLHSPNSEAGKHLQKIETNEARQNQADLMGVFAEMNHSAPNYEGIRESVYKNNTDLKYCLSWPSSVPYQSLALARSSLANPKIIPKEGIIAEHAAKFWKLVENCSDNSVLQELGDGRLDDWIRAAHKLGYKTTSTASSIEQPALAFPSAHASESESSAESADHQNLLDTHTRYDPKETATLSPQEGVDLLEERLKVEEESHSDIESDAPSLHNDSDMQDDVKSEPGEVMADSSMSEQETAEQVTVELINHRQVREEAMNNGGARILSELNSQDLNAQVRYFHITKRPEDIDRDTPVRCLVCAGEGHMAQACDKLECKKCGAYNLHPTHTCPQTAKCVKCRELGHSQTSCPYKLKNIAKSEIVCDLCQRNGHIEEDCELLWRTSGRPWESTAADKSVHLSCYECGQVGHLGNDCPTRRPGKTLGTSTWGSGVRHASTKGNTQISIKGRATRQQPIVLDDSEDDMANFHRPKMPLPTRKGQIKVNTVPAIPTSARSQTMYDEPYGHNTEYRNYRDDGRGRELRQETYRYDPAYESGARRSISPPYRDHRRDYRSDRYPPPSPQPSYQHQRPPPNANVYRPMPSSAQNAWSRHRV